MTSPLPPVARRVLADGVLCHIAVRTSHGPHLTPVVFVLDGGRVWLTTSRTSVKARAWKRDPTAAGLVRLGGLAVAFRGRIRTYDALDPLSWPAATVAGPRLIRAATRFSLKNARFFAGYAVDAGRVPFAWTPPGRVLVSMELSAGHVLAPRDGSVEESWGDWPSADAAAIGAARSFAALPSRRGLDLRVPARVRAALRSEGQGSLALDAGAGLMVLPARWRRVPGEGAYEAILPQRHLAFGVTDAGPPTPDGAPSALTIDRASAWRAAEMTGMLLQGRATAHAPGSVRRGGPALRARLAGDEGNVPIQDRILVRLRPERIVWWEGWTSAVVASR